MDFQKPVIEIIKTRRSCRTYNGMAIDSSRLQKLENYIADINQKAEIKARFALAQSHSPGSQEAVKLGTYGVIAGAPAYIVGILDKRENKESEFGGLFEKIILFATDLDLQTCWLGGTFKESDFQQTTPLTENEFIPIVSPVGIKKENPRILESAMRAMAGSNKRKPWSELFFAGNAATPLTQQDAGPYALPLEMVRLGPSASNKQPWRIIKDDHSFHFFLCRTKGYRTARYDMQKNDIGIAQCHFELTANELRLMGAWHHCDGINGPQDWEYMATWLAESV